MAFIAIQMKGLHWHGQPSPAIIAQPYPLDTSQIQLPNGPHTHLHCYGRDQNLVGLRQVEPIWVPGRERHLFWKASAALSHLNLPSHTPRPLALRSSGTQTCKRVSEAGVEWGGREKGLSEGHVLSWLRQRCLSHQNLCPIKGQASGHFPERNFPPINLIHASACLTDGPGSPGGDMTSRG